jgi:hypothetical protein
MATGDQSGTWGDTTNTNLGTLLEQAITGYLSVAQGDTANLTLTTTNGASDQARNAVIRITGALTATRNVVIQTAAKLYTIANDTTGGFSIVVKTSGGTGVSVPPGAMVDVYSDGTNAVQGANYWTGSIGGITYLDAGAAVGPNFDLFRDSTSPAANDILGRVTFNGRDSAGNKQEYASIEAVIVDPTSTSEDASLDTYVVVAGTRTLISSTTLAGDTSKAFIPSASTVPTNGMYLPAANTLGWAINSAAEVQLTATALSPAADGGSSLGTTALGWQDLFSNTGFVWNIENGNWVATHTSGILTVGTGDLRVTTAGTNTASVVTVGGTQTLTAKTLTSPVMSNPSYSGNLTVGTFSLTGATRGTSVDYTTYSHSGTGTGLEFVLAAYNANGLVGNINTNGTTTAYVTSSDQNLKTNFRDFDAGALIDNLHVYHFDWKSGGDGYGVKAQEAYEVFPDAITPGSPQDEYGSAGYQNWGADYSKFVPLLLEEVQALRKRVTGLEAAR